MRALLATAAVAALLVVAAAPPARAADPPIRPKVVSLRLKMGLMGQITLYAPAMSRPDLLPVLFFAGDWGWRPLQQESASHLASEGRFVVGIDSTEYFKRRLEAADWAADLKQLRDFTNEKAGRPAGGPVLLVGYCWGGEVIPYMLNRGGASGFAGAVLLGPDKDSAFIYRVSLQMTNVPSPPDEAFNVAEELKRLPAGFPVAFIEGELDTNSAARTLEALVPGPHKRAVVPGGDRQFREVRNIYLGLLSQALAWIEGQGKGAPPTDPPAGGR
ncbi:MAG TPA: AcvB/VirJ family lysyl-phosphatidylglycerol hydrolase [Candidatus Polarisedimenticolia bacterium]|nr:AcvB/VirJ family lysyl-phosphatidylglycerol hydrolase [Candidatus Polarisedimenticolia bacterium]